MSDTSCPETAPSYLQRPHVIQSDDSGHRYLIPEHLLQEFARWVEYWEGDEPPTADEVCPTQDFEEYAIDGSGSIRIWAWDILGATGGRIAPVLIGDTVTDGEITGVVTEVIADWHGPGTGRCYVIRLTEEFTHPEITVEVGGKMIRRESDLRVLS